MFVECIESGERMAENIAGILGGMGPEATVDLYRLIILLTPAKIDQEHFRVLIYSNPKIPDRTRAILGEGENPLPQLIESAQVLEKGGAGIIAIPCNAAHYYLNDIAAQVRIPILNMIEETRDAFRLLSPEAKAVGLLAATGTVRSRIYHEVFAQAGVEVLVPEDKDQACLHAGIGLVKAGSQDRFTQESFQSIGARLVKAGAKSVILGCTEISLTFNTRQVDYVTLNPARILAQAVVDWALGKK
jgi:aspartate racemase